MSEMVQSVIPEDVLEEWVRPLIVEALGPFALIFIGVGSIIITGGNDLVAIALAHGLAIGLMVAAAGHISGGLYNPALTVGVMLTGKLDPLKGTAYIIAQLAGAVIAALCLIALFPDSATDPVSLGTPIISSELTVGQAVGIEIVLTFFLMYVVFGTAIDKRGPTAIAPLAIGLVITMDIFAAGPATGAAMNPARAFGPALVDGTWDDHWVYWVGPIGGAIIAAVLYAFVLIKPPLEEERPHPER